MQFKFRKNLAMEEVFNDMFGCKNKHHLCKTCDYWKTYMKLQDSKACACLCLINGPNPYAQIYTYPNSTCKNWIKRNKLHFKKSRDSIKIKTSVMD
jgi:hypothetical protein